MVMVRSLALLAGLAGLAGGYALALWAGLRAPSGSCLTLGALVTIGAVGGLALAVAELLLDGS